MEFKRTFDRFSTRCGHVIIIAILLVNLISAQEENENSNDRDQCGNGGSCCNGIQGVPGNPGMQGNPGIQGPYAPKGDRGETGQPGNIGERGHMGHKGLEGMPGERGVKGLDGMPGERGVKGNTGDHTPIPITPRVAFSVSRDSPLVASSGNEVVIYNIVNTNIGEHYNQNTGKFTCPVNGVYYFTMTAQRDTIHRLHICFMRNDSRLACAYAHQTTQYGTATNSIILDIQEGDEIWVRLLSGHALYSSSSQFTTFSGYLIYSE